MSATLAQWVEQSTREPKVKDMNPATATVTGRKMLKERLKFSNFFKVLEKLTTF
jgi:hypothetical protein